MVDLIKKLHKYSSEDTRRVGGPANVLTLCRYLCPDMSVLRGWLMIFGVNVSNPPEGSCCREIVDLSPALSARGSAEHPALHVRVHVHVQ